VLPEEILTAEILLPLMVKPEVPDPVIDSLLSKYTLEGCELSILKLESTGGTLEYK
jgi:hypothetical protein